MLFNQIEFIILFATTMLLLVAVKKFRAQKTILLVASYYFYGYWDWRFLLLIMGCTVVNWFAARRIAMEQSACLRKAWIIMALVASLGVLGFFKYFNFFIDSLNTIIHPLGWSLGRLNIILPVGISFFTFQTLSYTMDVYRRELKPCRSLPDFALFVAFFPQLVAGPIVRASEFLPQLETPRRLSWMQAYEGVRIFIIGFFKKVFLADRLAPFVDTVFEHAGAFDGATVWLGVLAYAVQIYCDFSGYSDMAIGLARIMGYKFSKNFDTPYIATSIQEFWRRWHISLSTWLRDYLYIPLGGSRHGRIRTYVNLMITMLLGGLWHGASWSFVAWGGLHGVALAAHRWLSESERENIINARIQSLVGWIITMVIVLTGWVFFRATSFAQAAMILEKMFTLWRGVSWMHPFALFAVVGLSIHHLLLVIRKYPTWLSLPLSHWVTPAALLLLVGLSILFYPTGHAPFIYFQF